MFLEVLLDEIERDHHRFLLRSPSTGEISDYRMKRLTFGVSASPYLATQILRQAAIDDDDQHSQAVNVIRETFCVDDCLTGANTIEEAIHLQRDLVELLKKAGITLRKWITNSPEILATIPEELTDKSKEDVVITDPSEHNKALGIHWDTNNDNLYVSIPSINNEVPTKCSMASVVAKLYDALGWFAPATLQIKILLQELWLPKLGWDDPIPTDAVVKWTAWKTQLPLLVAKPNRDATTATQTRSETFSCIASPMPQTRVMEPSSI